MVQRNRVEQRLQEVNNGNGSSYITRSKLLFQTLPEIPRNKVKKEVSRSPRNTSLEAVLPVRSNRVHRKDKTSENDQIQSKK